MRWTGFGLAAPILAALLLLPLTACEKEGPAEKAGAKVDQAVEETKEEARQAKETLEENLGLDKDQGLAEEAKEEYHQTKEQLEDKMNR